VEESNNVETAAALCITVGNVKVRQHRARVQKHLDHCEICLRSWIQRATF
jgi:DNA-directed RNA polymerase specialized sigma24 family protein